MRTRKFLLFTLIILGSISNPEVLVSSNSIGVASEIQLRFDLVGAHASTYPYISKKAIGTIFRGKYATIATLMNDRQDENLLHACLLPSTSIDTSLNQYTVDCVLTSEDYQRDLQPWLLLRNFSRGGYNDIADGKMDVDIDLPPRGTALDLAINALRTDNPSAENDMLRALTTALNCEAEVAILNQSLFDKEKKNTEIFEGAYAYADDWGKNGRFEYLDYESKLVYGYLVDDCLGTQNSPNQVNSPNIAELATGILGVHYNSIGSKYGEVFLGRLPRSMITRDQIKGDSFIFSANRKTIHFPLNIGMLGKR